ncbi:MAG: hypothetical protein JWR61_4486 [Ferruginibacter sp.]|nr:hypothetical protein [Ferruginibacter sp.]
MTQMARIKNGLFMCLYSADVKNKIIETLIGRKKPIDECFGSKICVF